MSDRLGAVAAVGAAVGVRWTLLPSSPPSASSSPPWSPADARVALSARLDGRLVPGAPPRVDRTAVVAVDGVVDAPLRSALLSLLLGPAGDEAAPSPPTSLWERATADAAGAPPAWGLTGAALAALAAAPALAALGARVAALFPNTDVLLLPSADMQGEGGGDAAAILANAPTAGDVFAWHTDADPAATPPGTPWAAAYGAYANGDPGRPRLITVVVHLASEWRPAWCGETAFVDSGPSGVGLLVAPAPGRLVLFDADLAHRLLPPSPGAGRPRYSLALRLVLAPRAHAAAAPPALSAVAAALGGGTPVDVGSAAALARLARRVAAERREKEGGDL